MPSAIDKGIAHVSNMYYVYFPQLCPMKLDVYLYMKIYETTPMEILHTMDRS